MEFSEVGVEVVGEAEQKDTEISMQQLAKGMSAETVKQSVPGSIGWNKSTHDAWAQQVAITLEVRVAIL